MKELIIGCHVSFKKDTQLVGSVEEALSYGCNAFMFYTGAPQNTARATIDDSKTFEAMQIMKDNNMDLRNIVVHAPYIINPGNTANLDFAINFLRQELDRVEQLGITKLVLHPGSHVGLGVDTAIDNIIYVLNNCIMQDTKVTICLETMAGKGSEVGSDFSQIKRIIDGITYKEKVMVCLDTCHLNDAGYDLTKFDAILKEFDKVIGLNKIGCIHINDSKNEKSSHKDRHDNIGLGSIGFDTLLNIIYNDTLKDVPKILETPYIGDSNESKDRLYPPYKFEIEMIRNKKQNSNLLEDIRNYYK
jgi:deoxyribonuclease-4